MKIVLVTGGFDPLHSGHIEYFKEAKKLGDTLIVGVNSDSWLERKKGRAFLPLEERMLIVSSLEAVDAAYRFDDQDGTAISFINSMKEQYPTDQIIFANGGDRIATNIPEVIVPGVLFKFGVGGENKKNSSSWILEEWKTPKIERPWGYYRVLHEVPGLKVKELTVNPGQELSMQKHKHRSEHWVVSDGEATVYRQMDSGYALPPVHLVKHTEYKVPKDEWHKLSNPFEHPLKLVEIQFGAVCDEADIERK